MEAGAAPSSEPIDARTRQRLRGWAYRLTGDREFAEDAAQEAVARALAPGVPRDLPYLFRVVLNLVRSDSRRIARRRSEGDAPIDRVADPRSPEPIEMLLDRERDTQLWTALGTIPERERSALLLRFAEGLSCPDIALVLGITPNAVSCLLHRGKERMRALLAPRSPA